MNTRNRTELIVPRSSSFEGSILIRQRIAASYRRPFFEMLAERCSGDVIVVAGQPDANEGISQFSELDQARFQFVENIYKGSGPFYRYAQPDLLELLESEKPNIFFSEANPRFSDLRKTIAQVKQLRIPAIGWGVGTTDFWNKPLKRLRAWHRNRMLSLFDAMVCYSSRAAAQYQEVGFTKEQTVVLYNATVREPHASHAPDRQAVELPVNLISIGRLIESKGVDRLVRASAMVRSKGCDLLVNIVGDGPARESLEQLARSIDAPVRFHGRKSGDELAAVCRESDLFVLPGLGGLAIQEAMSYGLPVIVTEADGTEIDLVRDNGWIAAKENEDALAECIEQAISDPDDLRRRGAESFRIVKEEINLDLMADRFIEAANGFTEMFSTR